MKVSAQEEAYATWFLASLALAAIALFVVAVYLWMLRPPSSSFVMAVPTSTVGAADSASRVVPAGQSEQGPTPLGSRRRPDTGAGVPLQSLTPFSESASDSATVAKANVPASEDTGTIEGQIALQGRHDYSGVAVSLNNVPVGRTDPAGVFRLTVPAGRHDVRASYPGYVSAEASGVQVARGERISLAPISLLAGDTDDDEDIDLFDMVRCIVLFGRPAPAAMPHGDVNGDGVIDLRELTLVLRNYSTHSPVPWASEH